MALSVRPSICMSVWLSELFKHVPPLDINETYTSHSSHKMLVHVRFQVKGSRSQGFKFFVVSPLWLHACLTDSFNFWLKYNSWGDYVCTISNHKVKVTQVLWIQGHRGCSKFLSCPLCGSVPIWPIRFICGTNITLEMMMCHLSFPVKVT